LRYQCPYSALISEKLNIQFNPSCPIKRELGEIIKLTRSIELRGFEARIEFYKKKRFLCEEILIDLRYESLSLIVQPAIDQSTNPPVEGRGHRVVEERISTSTIDLGLICRHLLDRLALDHGDRHHGQWNLDRNNGL